MTIFWWSKTSGEERSQKQCQGHLDGNSLISQPTDAKVSRTSQAYSHAVSHEDSSMFSKLYF